jgi:hypothetical protein
MKEYAIEKALNDMLAGWDGQEFEVGHHLDLT